MLQHGHMLQPRPSTRYAPGITCRCRLGTFQLQLSSNSAYFTLIQAPLQGISPRDRRCPSCHGASMVVHCLPGNVSSCSSPTRDHVMNHMTTCGPVTDADACMMSTAWVTRQGTVVPQAVLVVLTDGLIVLILGTVASHAVLVELTDGLIALTQGTVVPHAVLIVLTWCHDNSGVRE